MPFRGRRRPRKLQCECRTSSLSPWRRLCCPQWRRLPPSAQRRECPRPPDGRQDLPQAGHPGRRPQGRHRFFLPRPPAPKDPRRGRSGRRQVPQCRRCRGHSGEQGCDCFERVSRRWRVLFRRRLRLKLSYRFPQCLKCRMPVKTMAMPYLLQASMESAS
ncbi:hypothetical protein SDC9_86519 [bioreactor metagenome]|uniref:Uncharacterized protein n=1 Tax=bioreactor metagenome TaxID=1076179 RepID=A0A644ZME8_9ZZZZ